MHKNIIAFLLSTLFLLTNTLPSTGNSAAQASCQITIDRSSVPDLYFNNLTLSIKVNDASNLVITANGQALPFTTSGEQIIVTTVESALNVSFTPGVNLNGLCDTTKTPLLENKKWAWSHGFDDNVGLAESIEEFRAKSWPATIFSIGKDYHQTREEGWITDEPFVNSTLLPEGWALGNHSWSHERFSNPDNPTHKTDILKGQTRAEEAVARSTVPGFKVMVFASPNFSSEYDQPFNEVTSTTDLKLLESGNEYMLTVTGATAFTSGGITAEPLLGKTKIGRDPAIGWDPDSVILRIDWMANNRSDTRGFWYNTLAHGSSEGSIKIVLDHVWDNYGPAGTNEAWVSSSTEIYSYILIRDNVILSVTKSDDMTPAPTPTNTPISTSTPTNTPVPISTPANTSIPTHTPTNTSVPQTIIVENELKIYLPLIIGG